MFVVLEGIDGSGKSTQVQAVVERLRRDLISGQAVNSVKFPVYESPTGALIQRMLQTGLKSHDSCVLFQSLMATNRYEFMAQYHVPNSLLICDRYTLSGLVYGLTQGLDRDWLLAINSHLPDPDLTIFLDVTPEESFRRRPERRDSMENDKDFLQFAYDQYRQHLPLGSMIVDGTRPTDFVTSDIIDKIALVNGSLTYRF